MSRIQLRLFGAFRDWRSNPVIEFDVFENSTIADLRVTLLGHLNTDDAGKGLMPLVADSVFADEQSTLLDSDSLIGRSRLAILPPVCGG